MKWVPPARDPAADFGGTPNQRGGVEGYWEGPGGRGVGRGWQQASKTEGCVRAWTAPETGTVRIAGRAMREYYHRAQGGPLKVKILRGQEQIWPQTNWATVALGDLTGVTHDITLKVTAGDVVRFVLHRGTVPEHDLIAWMPRIVYEETPAAARHRPSSASSAASRRPTPTVAATFGQPTGISPRASPSRRPRRSQTRRPRRKIKGSINMAAQGKSFPIPFPSRLGSTPCG